MKPALISPCIPDAPPQTLAATPQKPHTIIMLKITHSLPSNQQLLYHKMNRRKTKRAPEHEPAEA